MSAIAKPFLHPTVGTGQPINIEKCTGFAKVALGPDKRVGSPDQFRIVFNMEDGVKIEWNYTTQGTLDTAYTALLAAASAAIA